MARFKPDLKQAKKDPLWQFKQQTKLPFEAKIFREIKGLRAVRQIMKKGLLLSAIVGVAFTGAELVREGVEEVKGNNTILNVGPVILKNREKRSTEQVYEDIEEALLNMPGIEKLFSEEKLPQKEKEALLRQIIETMAEAGNIQTDQFTSTGLLSDGMYGAYGRLNIGNISIGADTILINNTSVESAALYDVAETVIHEMLHALDFENHMMSDNVSKFDKKLFSLPQLMASDTYFSSFAETNAHLVSSKIMLALKDKYAPDMGFYTFDKTQDVFQEMVEDLYNVNNNKNDFLLNLLSMNQETKNTSTTALKDYTLDKNNYQTKTLEELFLLAYEEKLKEQGVKYNGIDLKETHYYKTAMYAIGDLKDIRYCDFANENYNVMVDDIEAGLEALELRAQTMKSYDLAKELAKFASAIRYNSEEFSEDEIALMNEAILKYQDKIEEKHIARFGLKEEVKQTTLTTKSTEQKTATKEEVDFSR